MRRLWHPLWGDRRQELVFIGIGVALAAVAMRVELRDVEKYNHLLLLGCFALLVVVVAAVIGAVLRRRAPTAQSGGLAYQGAGATPAEPVTPRSYSPNNVGNDASARPWERSAPAALDSGANSGSPASDRAMNHVTST